MKKTQVALAALALVASTATLANGVKISGNLEAGVANTTSLKGGAFDGTGPTGTDSIGTYFSGGGAFSAGNNITFSGSEDLGNGLKADFNLTKGLSLSNGSDANGGTATGFTQQANIGLSGDFGTVRAGQQLSPFIASYAGTGTSGNGHFFVNRLLSIGGSSAFLVNGGTAAPGAGSGGFFVPNAISYSTPSIGGFTISALTTTKTGDFGGGLLADPVSTTSYQAYSVTGAIGAINASAAHHRRSEIYSATSVSANTALSSDLTLYANWMSTKYGSSVATMGGVTVGSYSLGLGYAMSDALNISLQYASNDISGGNQSLTGLSAKYNLSKRTFTYASWTSASNGASSNYDNRVGNTNALYAGNLDSNRTIAVGVGHSF